MASKKPSNSPSKSPSGSPPPGNQSESLRPVGGELLEEWGEDNDDDSALGQDAESSTASITSSILRYREVNGRTYHSDRVTDKTYYAANDDTQSNRLDILYHTFTLALDGKLYLAPLKNIKKAVDIGTGTGIWAMEFADLFPEAEIVGTDISPIQPTWVPPNLKFEIDDFTKNWTFGNETLDYVHLRCLVGCVVDWTALFKQAYAALKPGGWIESYDFDAFFQADDDTLDEKTASHLYNIVGLEGLKRLGMSINPRTVADKIQRKALEEAGFVNIQEHIVKIPSSEWSTDPKLKEIGLFSRATFDDIEGTMGLVCSACGWSKEQLAVFAAQVRKELRSLKVHSYYNGNVAYAQKPVAASSG